MRQRCGQFAHHAHAVDVREICLELLQSFALVLCTFAFCDIDNGADHFNKLPVGTENWMGQAMNVFNCAIR